MSDEGRLVAGRYRVIRRIGTGAMGAVWQAQDEVLHRTVAIKQLLLQPGLEEHEAEDARARTMREGRIAARLHHPNAISVFDVVTDDNGQPCLVMEYLESRSLAQELQRQRTLPPLEVASIGAQVASALKQAHAVGIVHRDIKPGNILLAGNGVVKITDFGISRAKDDVTVTKTGMIAGTPAYLAPEVAIGGDPGPESDVFSLGSTLYAATEGQPPFGLSENTLSLLHAVAAGQINPPRQSGPLTSVLAVMLHPDTRHRPTAEECEELLAAVARGETPLGGAADTPTTAHPTAGTGTAVLGAAGAAGAGAALGAAAAGDDEVPAGHSGNLGQDAGGYYDDRDDGYAATAAYPHQDYDDYGQSARGPEATRAAGDLDSTRAVPAGAYEDHDGYDADYRDAPPEDEPGEKRKWKLPAAVGSVVVLGLAAFAFWIFGSTTGGDAEPNNQQRPVATTSQVPTTTTTTSSEVVTEEPEYTETYSEPEYVPPPQEEEEENTYSPSPTRTYDPPEPTQPSPTSQAPTTESSASETDGPGTDPTGPQPPPATSNQ